MGILSFAVGLALVAAPGGSIWQPEEWTDLEGRAWTATELEGRVVLLDFWATWCAPCLAELPALARLDRRFDDHDFVLVGIALDALDRRRLRAFLLRHDIAWPQVHAPHGTEADIARRFGVDAVPATVLVDRRGRIVARDLRGPALETAIEALIEVGGRRTPDQSTQISTFGSRGGGSRITRPPRSRSTEQPPLVSKSHG